MWKINGIESLTFGSNTHFGGSPVAISLLGNNLSELKARYPWSLLNKGVHEDDDQPEFERDDISNILILIQKIEENVTTLKLAMSGT